MSRPKFKERTIQFYEVVVEEDGDQVRHQQFDFPGALASIARSGIADRLWSGPTQTLVGTVHTVDGEDNLLLHRVKETGEWLSVMDLQTGAWTELESKASEGYLDTTAVVFPPYGNLVAIMLGATSAPSHKALEAWLVALNVFNDARLVIRPLMSRAEVERLRTASGASRINIRIGTHNRTALAQHNGRLARFLRQATEDYGDLRVTISISVPPGRSGDGDRRELLADLRDLAEVMPISAEIAKARLVYSEEGGEEHGRLAEFVEHHITAKRRVAAVDEQGNSIRLTEALRIIRDVALDLEDELRLALDIPSD